MKLNIPQLTLVSQVGIRVDLKGINTPSVSGSSSFEVFDDWVDAWEWIWDRFSSVTIYSDGSGNASVNAATVADAQCVYALRGPKFNPHWW